MKWVIRTVVILVAAVVVSVATMWLTPSLMQTPNFPGDRGQFEQRQANPNQSANGSAPIRRERGGEHGDRGGGLFGIGVVLGSLIKVGIVVLPFAIYGAIKQKRRGERRTHLAVSQE